MMTGEQWSFNIKISELREIINRLLDKLQEEAGDLIDISEDDYWEISQGERYNILRGIGQPTLGKLSDDWEELQKLLKEDDYDIFLWHDLAHLAPILRAIGDRMSGG
jgi:hypothetical protein